MSKLIHVPKGDNSNDGGFFNSIDYPDHTLNLILI